ncbi:MAG: hypothetical protein EA379_08805 [Phycisphaerales bacterium]|jgi:hypothetical protein|nr:MAG: hypothetical protein EA379_08805 [Phycisphaerales bacterium]
MKALLCTTLAIGLMTTAAAAGPRFVIGVDSSANAAHLFDPNTGALVQQNYLEWGDLLGGGSTAKHALQVGNQIWVSDQIRDVIYRFDFSGGHLGNIGAQGLDNIKGMAVVGNEVWVTNAGTQNDAPGNSIVKIDIATASITGSVATSGSLFDLVTYQGRVLGSNITTQNLEWYDSNGNFDGNFHVPTPPGLRFPQQLFEKDNGNMLAAGFSTAGGNISGVYEFDADGNQIGIIAGEGFGPRGVLQLDNGQIMWTNGAGFWVDGTNVFDGDGSTVSGQYLSFVVIPAPGGAAMLAIGGLLAARRRR